MSDRSAMVFIIKQPWIVVDVETDYALLLVAVELADEGVLVGNWANS